MNTNRLHRKAMVASAFAALAVLVALGPSASRAAYHGSVNADVAKGVNRTDTIAVPDMQCGSCEKIIKSAVTKLRGIVAVQADAEANRVVVTYNPRRISKDRIEKAIAAAGYDAGAARTTVALQNELPMCCRPGAHDGDAGH